MKTVHYWHSCSEVASVTFIRWVRMRRHCGGEDNNKLGIGAVVQSDWRFCKLCYPKIQKGCRRGQRLLRPYWELYSTCNGARAKDKRKLIKRPTLQQYSKLLGRRK